MKTKSFIKIFAFLLITVMAVTFTACQESSEQGNISAVDLKKDREGNSITLPETIDKIVSMGPSNTEILVALGFGDKIIAADTYSENVEGIKTDISMFSMTDPDGEQIINLQPDVIFITGMSKAGGDDPFKVVSDAGICIIYIPSSSNIDGIKDDIRYMAAVMGAQSKGESIISDMEKEIADIKKIGDAVTDKKTVHFEVSASPYIYTSGNKTFIHDMIEIIGAKNVFGDQDEEWFLVADEAVVSANPDVILTSTNYIEDPTGEIKARPGWDSITAVKNDDVYYIDTDSSSRPSHNIVKAMKEMAKVIYPDKY